jgi:hypothetical protein
MQSLIVGDP